MVVSDNLAFGRGTYVHGIELKEEAPDQVTLAVVPSFSPQVRGVDPAEFRRLVIRFADSLAAVEAPARRSTVSRSAISKTKERGDYSRLPALVIPAVVGLSWLFVYRPALRFQAWRVGDEIDGLFVWRGGSVDWAGARVGGVAGTPESG